MNTSDILFILVAFYFILFLVSANITIASTEFTFDIFFDVGCVFGYMSYAVFTFVLLYLLYGKTTIKERIEKR